MIDRIVRPLGAFGLVALITLGGPIGGARADDGDAVEVSDEARRLFSLGVSLLDDADGARNEEAYRAFKAAYADSPSPKILGNLGLCAMRLERDQEAIDAWKVYLEKVPDAPEGFRAQIESDLKTLQTGLVTVKLTLPAEGASVVDLRVANDGSKVVNRYGPFDSTTATLGLRAGRHELTVEAEGYEETVVDLDAMPGATVEREVTMAPVETGGDPAAKPPEPDPGEDPPKPGGDDESGGIPTGVWVGVGVTAALAIGTGVVGGLALSKGSEYADTNDGTDPEAAQSIRDEAGTLNITTDILLGTTVAAAVVTTVLFFVLPGDEEAEEVGLGPITLDGVGATPVGEVSTPTGGALLVHGRF